MEHDEFLQVIRSPFHFATCDAVLRGCKIVDRSKPLQWRRLSKKVRSPLGPLCEGAPPAGGGGENCMEARNISGYGKVLSLRPYGPPLPLWRKRHLPRIGGVCLAEGGQTVKKVHCRGEHCSRVPVCRVIGLPEKALLRQVGGRTMFARTFSIGQSRCFLTNCFPACAGIFFVLYYPT